MLADHVAVSPQRGFSFRLRLSTGGWPIFKMFVQMRVVLVEFFVTDRRGLRMRGAQIRLPGGFRTHGAQRDQLLQFAVFANRAFRRRRRMQKQVLKPMSTATALVFVHRHGKSL